MNDMPLPPTPFQVKEFTQFIPGYEAWAQRDHPRNMGHDIQEWFDSLARDGENEYDIRQILQLANGNILVFFEVTPLASRELPCGRVCPECGTSLYFHHVCDRCGPEGAAAAEREGVGG